MSTTIDERVVEMRFDNKQFESNVQTSLSTLDKLKQSLNLDGAAKGLDSINAAAKNVNMSGLSGAVETVHAKFSALEIMAVTALANITNSVINTGKQMLHSLTIEPISQGFDEYELKMGSIQTIMMSTGEDLQTVNKYLNELNTYSDKTIYSFSDMTSNIGKFTNAGVKLEDAVMAIQGVSNAAAVSGANSNEASRAMYNFAQALSAGYVKLIDWKSIENANMATVEFKTQLLESAVAAGTLEKTADGMYKVLSTNAQGKTMDGVIDATHNFNDSLSYQWMTTEALVGTLRDYADENTEIGKKAFKAATEIKTFTMLMDTLKEAVGSGWAQTWEIVFGDFEEAKKLWTEIGDVVGGFIDKQSDARNAVLQGWKDLGGRSAVIEAAKNAFKGLTSVVTPVKEAFREIFPPITAETLMNITNALKEFSSHLKLSDKASANLKSTFKGLFAILDIIGQAFSAVFQAIKPLFGGLSSLGGGILGVTGSIGECLVKLDEFIKENDVFGKAIQGVIDFITKAIDAFKNFASGVKEALHIPDFGTIVENLKEFLNLVKENVKIPGLELIHSILERIHERMSSIGDSAGKMKSGVVKVMDELGTALSKCKFLDFLKGLWNAVKTIAGGIATAFGDLLGSVIEKIGDADFSGALDLLNSLSLGGIALGISKFLKSMSEPLDKLSNIGEKCGKILDSVRGCFEAYQQNLKANTLLKIAGAIAMLAASIVVISLVDSDKLSASLGAMTVMFTELIGAMAVYNKLGGVTGKGTSSLLIFAGTILILSSAVKKLGELDAEQLAVGLTGVGVLLAELSAFMKMADFDKKTTSSSIGILILAAAINVLASAVSDLGKMSLSELTKGLVGIGVLLTEIDLFLNTSKMSGGKTITTAVGITILAAALKILASVCEDFGKMKLEDIAKGLGSIGVLLAEITAFTKLTGDSGGLVSTGVGMIAIAAAMKIFASVISDIGSLSVEEIAKGLIAMGVALGEIAIAMHLMPDNMVTLGAGLVVVGAALEIVANVLSKLGSLTGEEIAKSLIAMGIALTELSIALNVMSGTLAGSAALLVAAAALAILTPVLSVLGAMSWEGIAKGLIAVAGAFAVIGVAGLVLTPIVPAILALAGAFALIGVGVLGIGAGLLAAGAGLSALAVGFTALAAAGTAGATAIVAALTVIITGIVALIPAVVKKIGEAIVVFAQAIAAGAPALGKAFLTLLQTLLGVLRTAVPDIVETFAQLIVALLKIVEKYAPTIIQSFLNIIVGFLKTVAKNIPKLVQAGVDIIVAFLDGIGKEVPRVVDAGFKMIIDLINGIADSCEENLPLLLEAIAHLATSIITGLVEGIGGGLSNILEAGKNLMGGFIQGIKDKLSDIKEAAINVVSGAVDAVKDFLGIHSPSRVAMGIGKNFSEGFAIGIANNSKKAEQAGKKLAKVPLDGMLDGLAKAEGVTKTVMKFAEALYLSSDAFKKEYTALKENQKALKDYKAERAQILDEMLKKSEKYKELTADNNKLEQENAEINKKITKLRKEGTKESLAAAEALEKIVAANKEQIETNEKAIKSLSGYKETKKEISDLAKEIEALQEKQSKYKKDSAEYKSLQKQIDEKRKESEELQKQVDTYDQLTESIKATRESIKTNVTYLAKNREELDKLVAKKKENSKLIKEEVKQNNELEARNKSLRKEREALAKLNTKAAKERIAQIDKEIAANEKTIASNKKKIEKQKANNKELKKDIEQLNEYILEQEKKLAEATEEMYQEIRNGLTDTFSDFLNPLKQSFDAGLNLLKQYNAQTADILGEFNSTNEDVNASQILSNMLAHVAGQNEFSAKMAALLAKGLNKDLYYQINAMGASSGMAYADAFLSMTESELADANGLFAMALANNSAMNFQSVIDNAMAEVGKTQAFNNALKAMAERGIPASTISEIKAMGADSGLALAQSFVSASDEQLATYMQQVGEKMKLNNEQWVSGIKEREKQLEEYSRLVKAASGLEGVTPEMLKDIGDMGVEEAMEALRQLLSMSDSELKDFTDSYSNYLTLAEETAAGVVESYANAGSESAKAYTDSLRENMKNDVGGYLVEGVAEGITKNTEKATQAATQMIEKTETAAKTAAEIKSPSQLFNREVGMNLTLGVAKGMTNKTVLNQVTGSVTTINNTAISAFHTYKSKYLDIGKNICAAFAQGINAERSTAISAAVSVAMDAYQAAKDALGINSPSTKFMQIGRYIDQGLAQGIYAEQSSVISAAVSVAVAMYAAQKAALDVNSPSKKMEELGRFVDEGLAIGLLNNAKLVTDSAGRVGGNVINAMTSTISKLSDAIENSVDAEPSIRPVLDLTNVEAGAGRISSMLSRTQAISISNGMNHPYNNGENQNGVRAATGNNITFTQNNYSPKSLSRIEIYRQTRNQISAMKEALT